METVTERSGGGGRRKGGRERGRETARDRGRRRQTESDRETQTDRDSESAHRKSHICTQQTRNRTPSKATPRRQHRVTATNAPAHWRRLGRIGDPLQWRIAVASVRPGSAAAVGVVVARGSRGQQVPAERSVADAALQKHDVVLLERPAEVGNAELRSNRAVGAGGV